MDQIEFADGFDRPDTLAFGLGSGQLAVVMGGALAAYSLMRSPESVTIFFWLPPRQAAVPVACEPSSRVHFAREVLSRESTAMAPKPDSIVCHGLLETCWSCSRALSTNRIERRHDWRAKGMTRCYLPFSTWCRPEQYGPRALSMAS